MTDTTTAWTVKPLSALSAGCLASNSGIYSSNSGIHSHPHVFKLLQADLVKGRSSTMMEPLLVMIGCGSEFEHSVALPLDMLRTVVTSPATGPALHPPTYRPMPGTSEMLASIRTAFSLNVTQLAHALRVERPTIYSWIREDVAPREDNLRRLAAVWELAELWMRVAARPIGTLLHHPPVIDGKSILDLLEDEPLRSHVLSEQLRRLGRQPEPPAPTKGRGGRRAAERLGLQVPSRTSPDRVSFETGQRLKTE